MASTRSPRPHQPSPKSPPAAKPAAASASTPKRDAPASDLPRVGSNMLTDCIDHAAARVESRQPDRATVATHFKRALTEAFPSGHSHRNLAAVITSILSRAMELIMVGQYPWAYVEMHAEMKRVLHSRIPWRLASLGRKADAAKLTTTGSLASYFKICEELGYWTEADVKFVAKIETIAVGTAERDFELLAKPYGRKKQIFDDYDDLKLTFDESAAHFAKLVALLIKVDRPHKRRYLGRRDDAPNPKVS